MSSNFGKAKRLVQFTIVGIVAGFYAVFAIFVYVYYNILFVLFSGVDKHVRFVDYFGFFLQNATDLFWIMFTRVKLLEFGVV